MSAKSLALRLSYPLAMLGAFTAFGLLMSLTDIVWIAAYGAGLFAAIWVTGHELSFPHRIEWTPSRQSIATDAAYMIGVQVLLAKGLAIATVAALTIWWTSDGGAPSRLWPHDGPIVLQVVLMILAADLFRYWLHIACHRLAPLWRLHAVHHSVKQLYWLNVGRFHPFEKSIQFVFDTLPFIVLGVADEVVALYFVFYAVNGFFQHSNCDVRLGILNQIVAGPELHRWHHALDLEKANHNYGNNLIVWDRLFGTRYLPADTAVKELGLDEPAYPQSFLGQMLAPFRNKAPGTQR
ncbi:MAG: sterol desaturase family protein [Alphaproteobacteria bacterium]|nr:sterol desaturase family protein [Alphaproteobacteria bacterium]